MSTITSSCVSKVSPIPAIAPVPTSWLRRLHTKVMAAWSIQAPVAIALCSGLIRLQVPNRIITFTDGHYGLQSVNLAEQVGDFVIRRKDGAWAYQLAVVIDDALMGVTQVVRGRDLLLSSPQQLYIAQLLNFPSPHFIHLPLLCNAAGQRLSKRDQSLDMASLRQRYTASELIGMLAHLAGLQPSLAPVTPQNLIAHFSWDKISCDNITT